MDLLQTLMSSPVVTVTPEAPISDALATMEKRNISALVIAKRNRPLGIFTERSLIEVTSSEEVDYSWPIRKVMSSPPCTASSDTDYREAYQLLLKHHIRHLIVVGKQDELVGIVTETDFLHHLGLEYFMEFKSVDQIMIRDLVTLTPGASAFSARKLMNDRRISSLVVEEDRYPIGIITERDLLRVIRRKKNLEDILVDEVMSSPVQTVFTDTSTHKAADILRKNKFRRLIVTRSNGRCAGIITETDIIKGLRSSYSDYLKKIIHKQSQQLHKAHKLIDDTFIQETMLQSLKELKKKKKELQEANIALRVMLDQHTRTREKIEEQVSIKLKKFIGPYLDLLRQSSLTEEQQEKISIISAHIETITSSFSSKAKEMFLNLSPRETLIADLVRQGKTSKDISKILNISYRTVETYRNNLRKKLGLNKKKVSLRTYLLTEAREN